MRKCEKPFPNWNPNTKISFIELDIIVCKLVLFINLYISAYCSSQIPPQPIRASNETTESLDEPGQIVTYTCDEGRYVH